MATSKNAKTEFESGHTLHDFAAMTDSGDHKVFTISGGTVFSNESGFAPDVKPNGVVTGLNLLSTHADNNKVTVAGFTANSAGTEYTVAATTATAVRPASAVSKVCSVIMDDTGAIDVVEGTDGSTTAFSETRGAAGGPPEIPADAVEIGQVRMTSDTAAAILATEIKQDVGTHVERYDYPVMISPINCVGLGLDATVPAKKNAFVEFSSAFPAIHASATYKKVYIKYYTPTFVEFQKSLDFIPIENSHSSQSTQYYNGTIGSVKSQIGQGSLKVLMDDNVTDAFLLRRDKVTTIRHYPDRNKTPYTLTQGTVGIKRTYPVDNQNQADVTLTGETVTAGFAV